jgi:hypothetical protein
MNIGSHGNKIFFSQITQLLSCFDFKGDEYGFRFLPFESLIEKDVFTNYSIGIFFLFTYVYINISDLNILDFIIIPIYFTNNITFNIQLQMSLVM